MSRGVGGLAEVLIDGAWALGWAVVGKVPEPVAGTAFRTVADAVWRLRTKDVRRLESNLARVRPDATAEDLRVLSRAGLRSYLRYWCEAFRLHTLSPAQVLARVVTHNEAAFRKALEAGGVVAALPHQANWDLAGAWIQAQGGTLTTVAERLRPERLFDRFVAYREAMGMEVLPLTGGADPFPILAERLTAGGLVCLVADRDLSARGLPVDFFGEPARMPAGPAALAVRTGAALMPVTMWYDGPAMHIRFHDPVRPRGGARSAIADLTQQVADAFAEGIAEHPQDWHMLQRLWEADLDPRPRGAMRAR